MAVEIKDIRNALATNLQTLNVSRQVSAYPLAAPTPPSLIVVGFDRIVRTGFGNPPRGSYELPFLVQGLAGKPTEQSAYMQLDNWLSPMGSLNVWAAIENDRTLGGKVSSLIVTSVDGVQFITTSPGVEMLGSTWHVQIEL